MENYPFLQFQMIYRAGVLSVRRVRVNGPSGGRINILSSVLDYDRAYVDIVFDGVAKANHKVG